MRPDWNHPLDADQALTQLALRLGLARPPKAPQSSGGIWNAGHDGELARRGFHPRWVRLETEDLRFLEGPTLLRNGSGEVWLLEHRKGSRYRVRGAEGTFVSRREDLDTLGLEAMDGLQEFPEGRIWVRMLRILLRFRAQWGIQVWLMVLGEMLALLSPLFTKLMMDRAFPEGAHGIFVLVITGTILAGVFQMVLGQISMRAGMYLETLMENWMERGMLLHLLRAPYLWIQGRTIGQVNQAFGGVSTAKSLISDGLLGTLYGAVMSVGYLFWMLAIFPAGAGFSLAWIALSGAWTLGLGYQQSKLSRVRLNTMVAQRSALVELLNGLPILKSIGAEGRLASRWGHLLDRDRYLGLHAYRVGAVGGFLFGIPSLIQGQILTVWAALKVVRGEMALGDMMAFSMMSAALSGGLGGVFSSIVSYWGARPQLELAQEFLDVAQDPAPEAPPVSHLSGPVEIEGLSFRYGPDRPWIFRNLDMVLEPGEIHAIRGPSGFGKSTLLRLLAGLYEPTEGRITIAGTWRPKEARNLIIYLPQFVHLFNTSIRENLKVFSGGAALPRLEEAAVLTGLDQVVGEMPMGYETLLAQGGVNLSGGQRQLVALTAVLASERPLLLLDEALANLDALRKAKLTQSELFKGRTLVYASHDSAWSLGERGGFAAGRAGKDLSAQSALEPATGGIRL